MKCMLMRSARVLAGVLFSLSVMAPGVWADGTETLGPPSIPIAGGTGVVAAGVGLEETQPGTIDLTVPGTPVQVIAYWECFGRVEAGALDDQILINGIPVTGTLIGGPTFFFTEAFAATHRADITGLGLVGEGANSLSVQGLDCTRERHGAGLLVIFDDGSTLSNITVRDGVDTAFANFMDPRRTTVAQTIDFPAATQPRIADLAMFFGSVKTFEPLRPTVIEITVDGVTDKIINQLGSQDGPQWDTLDVDVNIPPGATSVTVQAFSRDDLGTGQREASLVWLAAGLSVPVGPDIKLKKQVSLSDGAPFFDADDPDDPDVPVGSVRFLSNATYRLIVRNTGGETLSNLKITDATLGLFDVPVPGGNLRPGEERTIVASDTGFDALSFPFRCDSVGNKNNVATVVAQGVNTGSSVSDQDPANVNCIQGPAVTLLKQVSLTGGAPFFDADDASDPDTPVGQLGADATYRLIVRNIGDETLVNGVINDATLGLMNVPVPGAPLLPGEERVIASGDAGFGALFVQNRCATIGTKQNVAVVNATGEETGLPVRDENPANVTCVESCTLEVAKTCRVILPPSDDLLCDDKIAATTLRYIGPDRNNVTVVFDGKDESIATYDGVDLVSGVTILTQAGQNGFTIDSTALGVDELGSKLEIFVDGILEEIIHTSCSAIYAAGQPAPLDDNTPNPPNSDKGDPSPNWFVVNFQQKDGVFVELPVRQGADFCEIVAADGTLCEKRPTRISLRYNGGDCTQSMNTQDESKVSCFGDAGAAEPVRIVVSKDDGNNVTLDTLAANVNIGDVVTADAANAGRNDFDSDSRVRIFNSAGVLIQDIEFHTSCSQPLRIGDKYGSVEVVGFVNEDQGTVQTGADIEYAYKITNAGTTDAELTSVSDNQLGELLDPSPQDLSVGEMLTILAETFVDADVKNVVTVTGNTAGVPLAQCEANDSATVNVVVPPTPPGSCDIGKPLSLEFEYTGEACDPTLDNAQEGKFECAGNPMGAEPVRIVITKDPDKIGVTPSSETIGVGDTFTIAKNDGKELPSDTEFDVRQGLTTLQSLKIHTSCSKELVVGDRFGGTILRTFVPKN